MPLDLTDDESKLVQVMAWCHQATSHYLSQCWPSSMLPCGVIRPQWVDIFVLSIISQQWLCSYLIFFIIKDKNSLILHSQCQGCWWPGDTSNQGICSYGNDLILPEYSGFSIKRVHFSNRDMFGFVKVLIGSFESHWNLMDVNLSELQWHLSLVMWMLF